MNKAQRQSLNRLIQLASALPAYRDDATLLLPLLEKRRAKVREMIPRADQLAMRETAND